MRQRLQTMIIIILAALLVSGLVHAGGEPGTKEASEIAGGEIPGEGALLVSGQDVSGNDPGLQGNSENSCASAAGTVSGNDASQGTVSGNDASQGTVSGNDASQGTVSGNDASQGMVSGDEASQGTSPGGAVPPSENESEYMRSDGVTETAPGNPVPDYRGANEGLDENEVVETSDGKASSAVIFSLRVPKSLDFIMDPYELSGRGSIWSQEYCFENRGNTTLKLCLRNLHCETAEDVVIVKDGETAGETAAGSGKNAVLWLQMGNGDRVQVEEEPAAYEISLKPGEALVFQVQGKMSVNDCWEDGDVRLSMLYQAEPIVEEE